MVGIPDDDAAYDEEDIDACSPNVEISQRRAESSQGVMDDDAD